MGRKRSHASWMSCTASRKKTSRTSSSSRSTSRSWSSYQSPSAIDFWKIVGFDVTPTTASSSIRFCRVPSRYHWRESESIQTLWPCSLSACRRDFAMRQLLFHSRDLLQPLHVTLGAVEPCLEEGTDELRRELPPDDLRPEAEDVHVVVLDALMGRVRVVADRGADPRQLAGRDRGAHAGATDEHGALRSTRPDRIADLLRLVRVVDPRLGRVGSQVHRLVAELVDDREHALAQLDPTMVEGDRDSHGAVTVPGHGRPRPLSRARAAASGRRGACEREGRLRPSDLVDVRRRPRSRAARGALPLRLRRPEEPGERPADL